MLRVLRKCLTLALDVFGGIVIKFSVDKRKKKQILYLKQSTKVYAFLLIQIKNEML